MVITATYCNMNGITLMVESELEVINASLEDDQPTTTSFPTLQHTHST